MLGWASASASDEVCRFRCFVGAINRSKFCFVVGIHVLMPGQVGGFGVGR
jgi:hypothetical protein